MVILVASLWKVGDAATRALMVRFYGHLLRDPDPRVRGDAAEAMRRAMMSMIAEERRFAVVEWAGFVVYGLAGVPLPPRARTAGDLVADRLRCLMSKGPQQAGFGNKPTPHG